MDSRDFMKQLWRYKRGSISRRQFMGATGLGLATGVLAGAMPELLGPRPARAAGELGDRVSIATWPNYWDPANYEAFTKTTGVQIEIFTGNNEQMLAKMQAGASGWDVIVPTNYVIEDYVKLDLLEPLDLAKLPNFDVKTVEQRFNAAGSVNGAVYAVPKDWGTTGYLVNSSKVAEKMTSWKEFWDLSMDKYSGRATVHDYQLTTIGNALKYHGYSFNSMVPAELDKAEELLLKAKPHLFGITIDYLPAMRNGDAWIAMAWNGDAKVINNERPEMTYVIGKEGGEIWSDFYAVPKGATHRDAGYALIDFLLDPAVNAKEVVAHGYPSPDSRTNALLPKELLEDPIMYPAAELLTPLEFGAAGLVTDPRRAEILARFKSA